MTDRQRIAAVSSAPRAARSRHIEGDHAPHEAQHPQMALHLARGSFGVARAQAGNKPPPGASRHPVGRGTHRVMR